MRIGYAVFTFLWVAQVCAAGETGNIDLETGAGPAAFETGFPNLTPALGASVGYRLSPRLGLAAYFQSVSSIAPPLDPNFRGAQLHFGLESRFYPAFDDRLQFAVRLGAGRYEPVALLVPFGIADGPTLLVPQLTSFFAWDLGFKAAYDFPLTSWFSISTQAMVSIPSQAGAVGTVTTLISARLHGNPEPTRPAPDLRSDYFLGLLGGENWITRGGESSNPSLGGIAGCILDERLELGAFYRKIWTHLVINGDKQEQMGVEGQYLFAFLPGLGAGVELGMLVNSRSSNQWLSAALGPVISYDHKLAQSWSAGARLDFLDAEGATNNDSINLLATLRFWWD